MLSIFKKEINSKLLFCYFNTFIVGIMLQYNLFQIKKCFFMLYWLSQLNHCSPCVRSKLFLTIFALLIVFCKLNNKSFLQINIFCNFFLNCNFNFYSSRMGLCIDKACVYNFNLNHVLLLN